MNNMSGINNYKFSNLARGKRLIPEHAQEHNILFRLAVLDKKAVGTFWMLLLIMIVMVGFVGVGLFVVSSVAGDDSRVRTGEMSFSMMAILAAPDKIVFNIDSSKEIRINSERVRVSSFEAEYPTNIFAEIEDISGKQFSIEKTHLDKTRISKV